MGVLNLDAIRAEAGAEAHELILGGVTYTLPAVLPLGVASAESNDSALLCLFGANADLDVLKRELSTVRSDWDGADFDTDNPQTDVDLICERLYGIKKKGVQAPNREARRAGQKAKKAE